MLGPQWFVASLVDQFHIRQRLTTNVSMIIRISMIISMTSGFTRGFTTAVQEAMVAVAPPSFEGTRRWPHSVAARHNVHRVCSRCQCKTVEHACIFDANPWHRLIVSHSRLIVKLAIVGNEHNEHIRCWNFVISNSLCATRSQVQHRGPSTGPKCGVPSDLALELSWISARRVVPNTFYIAIRECLKYVWP